MRTALITGTGNRSHLRNGAILKKFLVCLFQLNRAEEAGWRGRHLSMP